MAQNKTRLIYFADPMCSWCYGFSPELSQVVEQLEDSTGFAIVLGGLRPYGTETMAQLRDFLQGHWQEVNTRSGQVFNYDILNKDTFVYDTEPACRAVVLMRQLQPDKTFDFFKAVQKAFYLENKNTNKTDTYVELAVQFGVDQNTFRTAFESEEIKALVKEDFSLAAQLGIRGFPSLVLEQEGKYYLISNGYMTAEHINTRIRQTSLQFESDPDKHR